MTTTVVVKAHQWNVGVQPIDSGEEKFPEEIVKIGTERTFHVHSTRDLRIREIPHEGSTR